MLKEWIILGDSRNMSEMNAIDRSDIIPYNKSKE